MVEHIIDADNFGSFYQSVGNNGTDDQVIVNIGVNFSGTITVDSQPGDSEYDTTIVNIPDGWTLNIVNLVEDGSIEDPSFKDYSYEIHNAEGQSVGTLSIRSNNIIGAPCFTRGTMIETADGPCAIEALAAGDLIVTRDNGLQPLRWIGKIRVGMTRLAANPNLRPVRIAAGALAPSVPARDLLVSPQHRMLVRSRIAQRMFGTTEILVAAKQLLAI